MNLDLSDMHAYCKNLKWTEMRNRAENCGKNQTDECH